MEQDTSQRVDELIEEWLSSGGKQTVHFRCKKCGTDGSKVVENTVDLDKLVRLRKELREAAAKGSGSAVITQDAARILAELRELTDDELAVELARVRSDGGTLEADA